MRPATALRIVPPTEKAIVLTAPNTNDAAAMWALARSAPELDANTSYAYLLWCRDFARTSVVAKSDEEVAGFVIGFVRPTQPDTLFVWQVAVAPHGRGKGIGAAMLHTLLDRLIPDGVIRMESTVTPGNTASAALFAAVARTRDLGLRREPLFAPTDFPDGHDPEDLFIVAEPDTKERTE